MKQSRPGDAEIPTPEQLAAYVDGQLDPALRNHVETWLRNHPEATAEIEEECQLARLWRATTPMEPEETKWATVLARIDIGFFRAQASRLRRRRFIGVGAAVALAATLLLLLVWPQRPEPAEAPASAEPLAVVSPDDVEIVSLRAADRVTLVVGVPPLTEPLVIASPGDVELQHVEPDADGMVPDIHMDEMSDTAMIVTPRSAAPARATGNFRQ
jgi:anti-sigma factor RsiW